MRTKIVTLACAAWVLGVYTGTESNAPPLWLWFFLLGLLCLTATRANHFRILCIVLSAHIFGNLYIREWRTVMSRECPYFLDSEVVVADTPDIREESVLLTVEVPGSVKILLTAPKNHDYRYGERLYVRGQVVPAEPFNGFNYPLFLERAGICGLVRRGTVRVISNAPISAKGLLISLRDTLQNRINRTLPEQEAAFLGGILLGSKRAIPDNIQQQLKATGTTHIIAISGANITILLDLLLVFLPLYGARSQFIATVSIAVFMCLLTGGSASVIRGAIVASIGRYVRFRGRRLRPASILLVSMVGFLLANPLLLRADPGFQLSYAAYAGLLFFATPIGNFVQAVPVVRKFPEVIRGAITETTAATLGSAPVSYSLFGQVVLLGLLVNPLILWLLPAITFLGLVLLGFGFLPLVAGFVRFPLWLLLHGVLEGIRWFAIRFGGIPP